MLPAAFLWTPFPQAALSGFCPNCRYTSSDTQPGAASLILADTFREQTFACILAVLWPY